MTINKSLLRPNTTKILFILILALAFILRFYRLSEYPALNADEAALGYNALSLIETGKDEHGNPWPIHFQSFNDYKPGLYVYLVLPFVYFFGLNELAVRIPGALLGVATVFLVYKMAMQLGVSKILTGKPGNNAPNITNQLLAITASFLLAISPWHIHFSRGGWEVNVATFFITFGIYLFLIWAKKPDRLVLLFLSFLAFVLSLYTYHSARIIVPILGMGLFITNFRFIRNNIRSVIIVGSISIIMCIPLIKDMAGPAGLSRASGVSIFADLGVVNRINEKRGGFEDPSGLVARAFHNKPIYYSFEFAKNWLSHYSPGFLFIEGDEIQRNKVPQMGQMYLFDILFIFVGLFIILKTNSLNLKPYSLILLWLIVAPVAAALTFQSPHALRSQNMVIPLVIVSALGLAFIISKIISLSRSGLPVPLPKWNIITLFILVAVVVWNFAHYQTNYWTNMSREYPFSSQYGVKELVKYVEDQKDDFDNIIVTDRYDQPYILFLFYTKYPPEKFQKDHELTPRDEYGFSTVRSFDIFRFQSINFDTIRTEYPNSLVVGTSEEIPNNEVVLKEIYGSNGYKYFEIVQIDL
jgi:4-amino-4-deoxy-L-arabinose transferase-like glycosyltransferase